MKKFNLLTLSLAAIFIFGAFGSIAKDFKGVITYKVTVTGSAVTDEVKAMMPKTMVLTVKDKKARSEMVMGMGKTISIADAEAQSTITLIDMMGQKIAINMTSEEIQKEISEAPEYTVEKMEETKDILGYTCKKAIIHSSEGTDIIIYYTDELGDGSAYFDKPEFKEINGVMMEFEVPEQQGLNMKFTAISVEKKNVSDSEFEIPEGFQVMTQDEMRKMFGGY